MKRFREDNTQGYDAAELADLNTAWEQITSHGAPSDDDDDIAVKSMLNNWSETLLSEYDAGKRGAGLTAWFYAP